MTTSLTVHDHDLTRPPHPTSLRRQHLPPWPVATADAHHRIPRHRMFESTNMAGTDQVCNAVVTMDYDSSSRPSHEFCYGSQPSTWQSSHAPRQSKEKSTEETDGDDIRVEPKKEQGRKEMEPRSEWWQHFIKVRVSNNLVKAGKCKYCHREIKAESRGHGTSALKRQFAICKRDPDRFNKDPKQGTLQAIQGEGIGTWRYDAEALRVAFAEMIIEDELPFCFGEKSGFRKFMTKASPRFILPSRRTCTRDVVRCFFKEKAKVKKFLQDSCQRVCLTTDCWSSQQLDGYMTMTASFIDENWILRKKVINFFLVKGHKGEDIRNHDQPCSMEEDEGMEAEAMKVKHGGWSDQLSTLVVLF